MNKLPIAQVTALVFSAIILLFQFLRISVLGGELSVTTQLPMQFSEEASLLTTIETILAFLVPALLLILSILLVIEECRKTTSAKRIKIYYILFILPAALLTINAIEKTLYIFAYEGRLSLRYTWDELLTSAIILTVYILTVFDKIKSGYLLMIACLVFVIIEVCRLSFPDISYAYVIGSNVYISTFASAVLLYLTYLFIGLSLTIYKRKAYTNK